MAYERYRRPAYQPGQANPYKISRSKIDLFIECPRCFWLDARLKISRPGMPGWSLNSAVDHLLKLEFDAIRANGKQHPLQKKYGIDAKPVAHDKLNVWRENFQGVEALHEPTNLLITGAIDDLWQNGNAEYIVVDYKSTSRNGSINKLGDKPWDDQYRRQLEVYQWLLRQNGLNVSDTGYWVYCNALKNKDGFDGKLEFDITLVSHKGKGDWIEPTLHRIKDCLDSDEVPKPGTACEHCQFIRNQQTAFSSQKA
jgi:hypothetical protein